MTTTATKLTPEQTLTALQAARAAMPDADDLPRTLSPRQVAAHERRRRELDFTIRGLQSAAISSAADLYARRDYLHGLKAALEKQITEAGDWRDVADGRARDQEYDRQRWLADSLHALQVGVGYWPNGAPQIPQPLYELMTRPPCASCGHRPEVKWLGTIPEIEAQIAEREKRIAEERASLDRLLAGAAALLAEPVTEPVTESATV